MKWPLQHPRLRSRRPTGEALLVSARLARMMRTEWEHNLAEQQCRQVSPEVLFPHHLLCRWLIWESGLWLNVFQNAFKVKGSLLISIGDYRTGGGVRMPSLLVCLLNEWPPTSLGASGKSVCCLLTLANEKPWLTDCLVPQPYITKSLNVAESLMLQVSKPECWARCPPPDRG